MSKLRYLLIFLRQLCNCLIVTSNHLIKLLFITGSLLLFSACSTNPSKIDNNYNGLSVAQHAINQVGAPYRYGGNTPAKGFDCSGLIHYAFIKAKAPRIPPRSVAQISYWGKAIPKNKLRRGDIIVFGRNKPWHAGIYIGSGRFVHAPSTGKYVRIDKLNQIYWAKQHPKFLRP